MIQLLINHRFLCIATDMVLNVQAKERKCYLGMTILAKNRWQFLNKPFCFIQLLLIANTIVIMRM